MESTRMIFLACPPSIYFTGTANDQEKIARCNETLIPHFLHLIQIILLEFQSQLLPILLAAYGVYKGFFANKELKDPWDDHDD